MIPAGVATEGLVLRRSDYSETSQLGVLFTRALGRVHVLAKGIKRPGHDLRGPMDLMALADVVVLPSRKSDLALLTRYRVRTGFPGLRRSARRLWAGFFVTEVLREGTRDMAPEPDLFDLAAASLDSLEGASGVQIHLLAQHFSLHFLRLGGFLPPFDRCVLCGQTAPPSGRVRFSIARSGVVCRRCAAARTTQLIAVEPPSRRAIASLLEHAEPAHALSIEVSPKEAHTLSAFLHRLLERTLEKELRSPPFLLH